ncbi:hypothetical protein JT358_06965 [Micrococcales bacterium 31B]|nr:hypothetical protein [Micrococcales bacterium 31B]
MLRYTSLLSFPAPPREYLRSSDLGRELVATLEAAEVRGMGGACFPAARKVAAALDESRGQRRPARVIINACDGEPDAQKDTHLMRANPRLVAAGAALVANATNADQVIYAAHEGNVGPASVLGEYGLPWCYMAVPERYVSSEAHSLNALADGEPARPRAAEGPLATLRRPVLVFNAETLARIAVAWQERHGDGNYLVPRLITLTGVPQPGVLEVTGQVTFGELLSLRGATQPAAVLLGGFGGVWLPWQHVAHVPVSDAGLAPLGATLGAGLVRVLETTECPVAFVATLADYLAAESAGQCGPCAFGLPSVARDWAEFRQPSTAEAAYGRLQRRLPLITGRGACAHPDGVVRMLASALATFAQHIARPCPYCRLTTLTTVESTLESAAYETVPAH